MSRLIACVCVACVLASVALWIGCEPEPVSVPPAAQPLAQESSTAPALSYGEVAFADRCAQARAVIEGVRAAQPPEMELLAPIWQTLSDRSLALSERIPDDIQELDRQDRDEYALDAALALALARDEEAAVRHEAIAYLRRMNYRLFDAVLINLLDDHSEPEIIRGYAAQHLAVSLSRLVARQGPWHEQVWLADVLWRALEHDPLITVRREAFVGLVEVGDRRIDLLLNQPEAASSVGLRDLILSSWREQGLVQPWSRLAPFLADPDERVVVQAVANCGVWQIAEARSDLERLASAPVAPDHVGRARRAAALSLTRLPPYPGVTP
ncbi:MAG: hypothetical protein ACYTF0_09520 [Planctomycetota bacterium]|jgi:hypothetical protein